MTLVDPIRPDVHEPLRYTWFKANGPVPDNQRVHNYLLAYASDFHFLFAALQPHGVSYWEPDMQVATINHSMWFRREFRLDDWLLYVVDSPSASGGRGLVRGQLLHPRRRAGGEHHAGRGDPPPGLNLPSSTVINKNGSQWLPFFYCGCRPSGGVTFRCSEAPSLWAKRSAHRAMTPSPVTLQAVPKLSWAR